MRVLKVDINLLGADYSIFYPRFIFDFGQLQWKITLIEYNQVEGNMEEKDILDANYL